MSVNTKKNLILLKEDHQLLMEYTRQKKGVLAAQRLHPGWLFDHIEEASVLDLYTMPGDVVRLNSTVMLRDTVSGHVYTYTVVVPEQADHRKGRVSVLSPIGAALFSARKGETVCWQPQVGGRLFTILQVKHPN